MGAAAVGSLPWGGWRAASSHAPYIIAACVAACAAAMKKHSLQKAGSQARSGEARTALVAAAAATGCLPEGEGRKRKREQ